MKPPEIVNASQADLDDLLARARPTFTLRTAVEPAPAPISSTLAGT
jgi:hypothetical protein